MERISPIDQALPEARYQLHEHIIHLLQSQIGTDVLYVSGKWHIVTQEILKSDKTDDWRHLTVNVTEPAHIIFNPLVKTHKAMMRGHGRSSARAMPEMWAVEGWHFPGVMVLPVRK